jgi:hypothetical protein
MAGVYLLYWTFLLPAHQDWNALSPAGWTALLAIAYVFGHFVQAIANLFLKWKKWRPECSVLNDESVVPPAIKRMLTDRASKVVGAAQAAALKPGVIYDIADHTVLQRGRTETRDLYVYREGYYRGMTLGLPLLAIGCFGRMLVGTPLLDVFGVSVAMTRATLFWTGIIALLMMSLYYTRYKRFASYRVRYAFYSFLVLRQTTTDEVEQ